MRHELRHEYSTYICAIINKGKEKSYEKDIIVDDYLSAGYRGKCPVGGKHAYGEGVLHDNLQ